MRHASDRTSATRGFEQEPWRFDQNASLSRSHNGGSYATRTEIKIEAASFRATQAPLKALYSKDAQSAFLTLKARGVPGEDTITCKVETGRGLATAGIHPKAGGSGLELCSGDMLLEALVACAGVSLRAAATMLDVTLKSAVVTAEGDVDLRGTLGVAEDVPVGFKQIRLAFDIDTDAPPATRAQLLQLVERYCVVFQTIQNSPKTQVRLSVVNG